MNKLSKDEASIVRAIKTINKATASQSPSQKKRSCEAIIDEIGDELFLSFSSFAAIANESYSSIQERAEQEELKKSAALNAIMEAAKATDAFSESKMTPEEFLASLLQQNTNKKTKRKSPQPRNISSDNKVYSPDPRTQTSTNNSHDHFKQGGY